MNPHAERSPHEWLATGFAQRVVHWMQQHGCMLSAEALRQVSLAARALSLATSAGHVCLPLHDLLDPTRHDATSRGPSAPDTPDPAVITLSGLRTALLRSGTVGTPEAPGVYPMILDSQDRLYLHRYFDYERRLAIRLQRAAAPATEPPLNEDDRARVRALLHRLFPGPGTGHLPVARQPDWQQIAVALALTRRLTIISGGPGTGKTTTVVSLLACLLTQQPQARIALAAPTGKAAARMTEAMRSRAEHLPQSLQTRLPATSHTVHRLLGVQPDGHGFVHHAGNRLPIDILIVDEASMLDLALATQLLEAVPEHARIVLLGDKDQLASVEAGAVFAQINRNPELSPEVRVTLSERFQLSVPAQPDAPPHASLVPAQAGLDSAVVWLNRNYRFNATSGIGLVAHAMRDGATDPLIAQLSANPYQVGVHAELAWIADTGEIGDRQLWSALTQSYAPLVASLLQAPGDVAGATAAFNEFRALCAVRQGPRGSRTLNLRLSEWMRQQMGAAPASPWFIGQALIVRQNDYLLKLFNGDVGLVLPDHAGELLVWFNDADQGYRSIHPARLPAHDHAYALTIHTSQGSEFERVAVILPDAPSRVASRELLYTGVTRARTSLLVCATASALRAAVQSPTRRDSGLLDRLAEVASGPTR